MKKLKVEKAVWIRNLKHPETGEHGFSRIYFGEEICEKKIPGAESVFSIAEYCRKNNLFFSFVTPRVREKGLNHIKDILEKLSDFSDKVEVIVNDWGVFNYLRKIGFSNIEIVIGRLLNKLPRDPRFKNIYSQLNSFQKESIGSSSLGIESTIEFFRTCGVKRIEWDNVWQNVYLMGDMDISLHYPYVYIAHGDNCLAASNGAGGTINRHNKNCRFECSDYTFRLKHPVLPVKLFHTGRAFFYYHEDLKDMLSHPEINRLVYRPEL